MSVDGVAYNYTIPKIKRELKLLNKYGYSVSNYTIPKIKRELKHVYVYFRIFSHYTTLYAAYAKPISTFEELKNVNLAPYENYVLTNDIIARVATLRAYLLSKRKVENRKTRVASMRATGRANVWVTGRARVRVSRESKRNDWTDKHMEGWRENG